MLFSFTSQNYVLEAFKDLKSRSKRRMAKVTARNVVVCSAFYLFIGIYGCITFALSSPSKNLLIEYQPGKRAPFLIVSQPENSKKKEKSQKLKNREKFEKIQKIRKNYDFLCF